MEAVVFDIDGTLIDSDVADAELFVLAVQRVLGVSDVNSDWTTYRHVTDQGVLRQILLDHGIAPEKGVFDAAKREFIGLLKNHVERHGPFREIPGAIDYLYRLIASDSHYVAYATGAWRESAILKLQSAGFPTDGVGICTSSEFEDRVSIMRGALSGAPTGIRTVTYYGDGVWDRAASRELGWRFMPVGRTLGGLSDYYSLEA